MPTPEAKDGGAQLSWDREGLGTDWVKSMVIADEQDPAAPTRGALDAVEMMVSRGGGSQCCRYTTTNQVLDREEGSG